MKINASYIFNILAVLIVAVSIYIFVEFKNTKSSIVKTYNDENLEYVKNFTKNLSESILKNIDADIYSTLNEDRELLLRLEEQFQFFITQRYKYLYLLDRTEDYKYRFLIDGSKNIEDKSEFLEPYIPINIEKFNEVYESKESAFFTHEGIESLRMTFLAPIVIEERVNAILVVDFSMDSYKKIKKRLEHFNDTFKIVIIFTTVMFIIIIWFASMDRRREREKEKAFIALKRKSSELKDESEKVHELNRTLESRVEEELEKNRQKDKRLMDQSRLAQMGEMLSMIAHQWRQPLSAISATSSSLELKATLGKSDDVTVKRLSSKISEYAQHLSQTINDFRDFFKSDKEMSNSSFCEVINSCLNIVEDSVKSQNIRILKDLDNSAIFKMYSSELKQVILNLIKNAEDILLENKIIDPYIKIVTYEDDSSHILEISDNAGGVPEDIIDKIFDPYFSTKLEKNGTGLGLYMSKSIIEDHCHGRLSVSNGSQGAVFKIELFTNKD
ncbi:MAG: HAMP domain-containing sensor histidine kinase [Campylobacterota bacterium]|nr:HAMP domain-containing sensor histidine kinase [Campylobacterota bacterium]